MVRGLFRFLLLLVLIAAVSAAAAGLHYCWRTGETPEWRAPSPAVWDRVREAMAIPWRRVRRAPGTAPPAGTAPSQKPAEPKAAECIEVYFAPCERSATGGIDDAFIRFLGSARHSIHGAFYDFELIEAADALVAQHRRGVDVRLVSDTDYRGREAVRRCLQAGIPVVFDNRRPFMHNKFCVVDGERVWTGSTNITANCMYRNNNNALLVCSGRLASNYAAEFAEMFQLRRFGEGSSHGTPFPSVMVGEVPVECYFAPEDNVSRAIILALGRARTSIDFLAFSFTSKPIARRMADRARAGVRVRGVFDTTQAGSRYSQDDYLAEQGALVYLDTNPYAMHHKVIVIDVATVITGSYNFTKAADTQNDENVLFIHAPAVARRYVDELEVLIRR